MAYSEFDFTVLEFMRDYPMTALHIRTTGEYDAAQSKVVETVTSTPVEAILLDYTLQSNGMGVVMGTEIQAGDKQLFVRPVHKTTPGATPIAIDSTTDTIQVAGVLYKIVTVKEINPSGADAILYELLLRR